MRLDGFPYLCRAELGFALALECEQAVVGYEANLDVYAVLLVPGLSGRMHVGLAPILRGQEV